MISVATTSKQHRALWHYIEYPQGERGGNEICVRVTQAGQPMDLHRFWDGIITSSQNLTPVLPAGYLVRASRIADRRMILARYRLADLLTRVAGN